MGPVAAGAVPGEHLALPNINSSSRASIPLAPPGQRSAGTTAWLGGPWALPGYGQPPTAGSLQRRVGTLCQVCPLPGAKPLVQADDADLVSSTVPVGIPHVLQHLVLGEDVTPTPAIAGCPPLGLPVGAPVGLYGRGQRWGCGCWLGGWGGSCLQWVLPVGCWWGGQGHARPSPSPVPRRAAQPCSSGSFSASARPGANTLGK